MRIVVIIFSCYILIKAKNESDINYGSITICWNLLKTFIILFDKIYVALAKKYSLSNEIRVKIFIFKI